MKATDPSSHSAQTELQNYVPDNDWVVTDASREYVFYFGNEGRDGGALAYTFTLHSRGAVIQAGLIGPAISAYLLSEIWNVIFYSLTHCIFVMRDITYLFQ